MGLDGDSAVISLEVMVEYRLEILLLLSAVGGVLPPLLPPLVEGVPLLLNQEIPRLLLLSLSLDYHPDFDYH